MILVQFGIGSVLLSLASKCMATAGPRPYSAVPLSHLRAAHIDFLDQFDLLLLFNVVCIETVLEQRCAVLCKYNSAPICKILIVPLKPSNNDTALLQMYSFLGDKGIGSVSYRFCDNGARPLTTWWHLLYMLKHTLFEEYVAIDENYGTTV